MPEFAIQQNDGGISGDGTKPGPAPGCFTPQPAYFGHGPIRNIKNASVGQVDVPCEAALGCGSMPPSITATRKIPSCSVSFPSFLPVPFRPVPFRPVNSPSGPTWIPGTAFCRPGFHEQFSTDQGCWILENCSAEKRFPNKIGSRGETFQV